MLHWEIAPCIVYPLYASLVEGYIATYVELYCAWIHINMHSYVYV